MDTDKDSTMSEDFVRLVQVLAEDGQLLEWFISLKGLPDNLRHSQLGNIAEKMKTNKENPELIAVMESLKSPAVFKAAMKVVESIRKDPSP